jgi:hypothetical protein
LQTTSANAEVAVLSNLGRRAALSPEPAFACYAILLAGFYFRRRSFLVYFSVVQSFPAQEVHLQFLQENK